MKNIHNAAYDVLFEADLLDAYQSTVDEVSPLSYFVTFRHIERENRFVKIYVGYEQTNNGILSLDKVEITDYAHMSSAERNMFLEDLALAIDPDFYDY